jgi:hypothetical protein
MRFLLVATMTLKGWSIITKGDHSGYSCLESDISYAHSSTTLTFNLTSNQTLTQARTLYNPLLQIRWAASDLCNLETHPTAPGVSHTGGCVPDYAWPTTRATSFAGATAGTLNSDSFAPTAPPADGGGSGSGTQQGIPGPAVAGIVVGVVFGLLLLGLGLWCIRKYRKKRLGAAALVAAVPGSKGESESGSSAAAELQTVEKVAEIDNDPRAQLEPAELNAWVPPEQRAALVDQKGSPEETVSPVSPVHAAGVAELSSKTPALTTATMMESSRSNENVPPAYQGGNSSELEALKAQHAQLESRRQALLQIQQIESEQATLQERMRALERNGKT